MTDNSLKIRILKIPNKLDYLGDKLHNNVLEIPILDGKNKYGIAFCYANNGVGKTSICNEIFMNTKYIDKKIEVFSYELHMYIDSKNQFRVGENLGKIEELKKTNINQFYKIHEKLFNFYKVFSCYPRSDLYKIYISKIDFFGIKFLNYKYNKNDSINIDINNRHKQYLQFTNQILKKDLSSIQYIDFNLKDVFVKIGESVNISKNIDDNLWFLLNNKLKKFLQKITIDVEKIKAQINEIKKINSFSKKYKITFIKDIYDVIQDIDSLDECLICGNKITSFKEIKSNMKKKINEVYKRLKKVKITNFIKEYISKIQESENWDSKCNFKINILENLNKLLKNNIKLADIDECKKWIDKIYETKNYPNIFFNDYLLNLFLNIENNGIKFSTIIDNNSEIKKYEKRKLIFDKDEFNFVTKLIIENIGENRLKIDKKKFEFSIDNVDMEGTDSLKNISNISSGEKNFIALSFSLFSFLNKFRKNEFDVLCFDDPFSSYDSNFKFQILHLINLFSNKGMPIIVLTHSTDYFSLQKDSFKYNNNFYFIKTLKTEVDSSKEFGFTKVDIQEIKSLSIKGLIKLLKSSFHRSLNTCNLEKISLLIFSYLPILRSIAYLITDKNNDEIDIISQLLHFKKKCLISDSDPPINFFNLFLSIPKNVNDINWKDIFSNMIKISQIEYLKKIIDTDFKFLDCFFEKLNFIKYCFKIAIYSIYIRKTIEYKCSLNIDGNIWDKYENGNLSIRKLINETKYIPKNQKIEIKNIKIIADDVIHQENNNNFISLALEITPKLLKKYINIIERIK